MALAYFDADFVPEFGWTEAKQCEYDIKRRNEATTSNSQNARRAAAHMWRLVTSSTVSYSVHDCPVRDNSYAARRNSGAAPETWRLGNLLPGFSVMTHVNAFDQE